MSDNLSKDCHVIFCDVCTEEDRKPARKTCMKCEISMCVQHLQVHLTTPVLLQTHPLTEPISSGPGGLAGTIKCPQHGKLLEYYCLDDLTCVCVSCAIEDQHRLHNMKTFPTAHKELMEKLQAEQQALLPKTGGELTSLEKWEKSEREKLGRSSARLIEAVTKLRDLSLTSVQTSVSARMVSLKTSKSSLQAAKTEEDAFRFLQMYAQVHQDLEKAKAVDLRQGLEPGSDRDKLVQEIQQSSEKLMEQVSQFCGSLLTHVDLENHLVLSAFRSNLYFDKKTFGQGLSLSKDGRKVFYSNELEKSILLMEGITDFAASDRHSWGISLSKDCDWIIGLCDQTFAQNFNSTTGLFGQISAADICNNNIFGLCCKGNQLNTIATQNEEDFNTAPKRSCQRPRHQVQQQNQGTQQSVSHQVISNPEDEGKQVARPKKVGVMWSGPNSELSFYNVTGQYQRRKIATITISSTGQQLSPFVCFQKEESQDSADDLQHGRQGPVFVTHQQKQWRCSCGRVNTIQKNQYYGGSFGQMYSQQTCAYCGLPCDASCITEVLCELL